MYLLISDLYIVHPFSNSVHLALSMTSAFHGDSISSCTQLYKIIAIFVVFSTTSRINITSSSRDANFFTFPILVIISRLTTYYLDFWVKNISKNFLFFHTHSYFMLHFFVLFCRNIYILFKCLDQTKPISSSRMVPIFLKLGGSLSLKY